LRARLRSRQNSVNLAFNQLYLQKLVKQRDYSGDWIDIDEQVERYISHCNEEIQSLKKDIKKGNGGILMKCWLMNVLEYKEKALNSEIMLTKEWNKLAGVREQGRFIFVGSEICMDVWPREIISSNSTKSL